MSSTAAFLSRVLARIESLGANCGHEVGENVGKLREYLEDVRNLLQERNRDVDFKSKVIKIAHDIENAVERQATLEQHGKGSRNASLLNRCTGKIPLGNFLQNIKKRIRDLKQLHPPLEAGPEADTSSCIATTSRCRNCGLEDNLDSADTAVLEMQIKGLRSAFKRTRVQLTHIAITGLAGIGKSALAWKMFTEVKAEGKLNVHSWVCLSSDSRDVDVLVSLLIDIDKDLVRDELLKSGLAKLKKKCYERLNGKGFFIILDGVPSKNLWDSISDIFPDDARSTVLITTRDEDLASYKIFIKHDVPCLKRTDSEKLFIRRTQVKFPEPKEMSASLQNTMSIIMRMCQDIPAEIIQVASRFKGKKVEEWDEILFEMLKDEKLETSVLKSLALSYDSLKPDVKPCFLYLGQFPPDQPIQVEKLSLMWIAEGLVSNKQHAEKCLADLVRGNLVIQNAGGKSCHLQEMCCRLCILKGKEEGFLATQADSKTAGTKRSSGNWGKAARLVIDQLKEDDIYVYFHETRRTRTLLFFDDDRSRNLLSLWHKMYAESKNFKWTRVLDFDGIDFGAMKRLISIDKLSYLRYLGFGRCYKLEEFPLSRCSFPYLETLDLRVRAGVEVIIPNVLWKMSNLKFLYLPLAFKCKNGREKLKLDGLKKLEIIENFHAGVCDVNDLQQFEHLQIITIIADGEHAQLDQLIWNIGVHSSLHPSNKLSLVLKDFDCYTRERQDTLKKLLECRGIHNLNLEGYIKRMPGNLTMAQNFTDIVFDGTEFQDDPMPIIGQLKHLKSLVLSNNAVTVDEISCAESSFPELERLEIINLPSLEKWVLEDPEAMQKLSFMTINKCHKLVTLPDYLKFVQTLRKFKIQSMPDQLKNHIRDSFGVISEEPVDEHCTIFIILEDK